MQPNRKSMKETQYISSDFLAPRDAWDKLSIEEQAAMMKAAVSEGILDLGTIRQKYNEFAEGGNTVDDLVDHYTMQSTGEIFSFAPAPLRYLNYAYTPENIKKFTKGFLSFTAPLTFGIKYINQDAK